jgi:hypothetical protein
MVRKEGGDPFLPPVNETGVGDAVLMKEVAAAAAINEA